jgi:type IV pilus assembly protein PilY1
MRTRKTTLWQVLALVAAGFTAVSNAAAQTGCEVPLFVQEGTVEANVMILFDNSGSMNEAVFHPDYDYTVTWVGPFVANSTYYINSSGMYAPRNIPSRPSGANQTTPTAPLVRSFGQQGRYRGNYLNWIFYHATDEQRASLPQLTLINVAHDVVADIVDRTERVRFGVTVFNGENGGNVIAQCGADKATLINTIRNIQATSWTPLAETMETILNYYKRTDASAPITAHCQKNFIVVVTDGFPTKDRNISAYLVDADGDGLDPGNCASIGSPDANSNDCSHHFDDIAYWMYNNDLRADLYDVQNVITYTIGFNIDFELLMLAAQKGGGLYMSASNAVELWTSLELVMLDIINRLSSGAAVAVVSTERGDEERLYRGKFMPGTWHGYLEAFALPYTNGDTPLWEAGYLLMQRAASTRTITAGLGGSMMSFTEGNATVLQPYLGASDPAEAATLIRWVRGDNAGSLRNRNNWKLGDIIHSTPVVVGAPSNFSTDPSYQTFMTAHATRAKMVYVGANDGMMHAFYADTGQEAWAFIPEFALPKLAAIADTAYCHTYTVDLTASVRDCKIGGAWKTVLLGGGRQGGASYFALDITLPNSPSLLWQVELPDNKPFASDAQFAVIGGQPVMLVGSGLDTTDGRAYLQVYSVSDGSHLGGVLLSSDSSRRNKATAATPVDIDLDDNHDFCYVADLQGHVWKLDFRGSTNPASWDRYCLWQGDDEITGRPTAAYAGGGTINVYFGTGAYLVEDDLSTTDDHIFGCIFDRQDGSQYATLVNQSGSINDLTGQDGWYIDLENIAGERVTEPAVVVAGVVFFTAYVPSQEVCASGGNSWLYRLDYSNGSVPDDGESDEWDGERCIDLGQGVASRPVVDIVNAEVIVQSSDATIHVQSVGQAYFHVIVRDWHENFDYVTLPPGE